jgi:hypothetical protein
MRKHGYFQLHVLSRNEYWHFCYKKHTSFNYLKQYTNTLQEPRLPKIEPLSHYRRCPRETKTASVKIYDWNLTISPSWGSIPWTVWLTLGRTVTLNLTSQRQADMWTFLKFICEISLYFVCLIWDCQGSVMRTTISLLGCDAVYFDRLVPKFRTNLSQQAPADVSTYLPNYTASHRDLQVDMSRQNNEKCKKKNINA